jgi:hypothetical protein
MIHDLTTKTIQMTQQEAIDMITLLSLALTDSNSLDRGVFAKNVVAESTDKQFASKIIFVVNKE